MPANRPTAAELLVAIREYLEQDIKPQFTQPATTVDDIGTKSLALNNAIAINLLKLLEREAGMRAAQQAQECSLLRAILPCSANADLDMLNEQLIEHIEAATFDDNDLIVLRALQQISLSKLAIDNPSYSTLLKHRQ